MGTFSIMNDKMGIMQQKVVITHLMVNTYIYLEEKNKIVKFLHQDNQLSG